MSPQPELSFDIFISYTSDDQAAVVAVENELTRLGLKVWRYTDEIAAGALFPREIETGLNASKCFVLFHSTDILWRQRACCSEPTWYPEANLGRGLWNLDIALCRSVFGLSQPAPLGY